MLVSLLTLFSIFKIWIAVFWRPRDEGGETPVRRRAPALMIVPTAILAVLTLAIGLGAGPLYRLSNRVAADLVDPVLYRDAVLEQAGP